MSKVAWLFPGQGSQTVGMGSNLAKTECAAKMLLQEADQILGFSLSSLMFQGPEDKLKLTEYTQPAILTHSTMIIKAFGNKLPKADFVAGHSLGEYSALVASNAITFSDAVRIVHKRGQVMQTAVPHGIGTMAAIMGVTNASIESACQSAQLHTGLTVAPANFNGPGQVVIAGHTEAVDAAIEILKANGCRKTVKLPVSAPFHSPLMEPAKLAMEPALKPLAISVPSSPLINNIDAAIVSDPETIRDGLIRQISGTVQWEAITSLLLQQGVTKFFELGPGTVLKNLLRRQIRDQGIEGTQIYSIADQNDFGAAMQDLNS